MSYYIVAKLMANHGNMSEITAELNILQAHTVNEPGCIYFDIYHAQDEPGVFYLWEAWHCEADLKRHYDAPHTQAYFAKQHTRILSCQPISKLTA